MLKKELYNLSLVLVWPDIPQNAGNIIRLCAVAGAGLHLIKPLGFVWSNRHVRRASMDYIARVDVQLHADIPAYQRSTQARHWLFSANAERNLFDVHFAPGDRLVFGSETSGLPAEFVSLFSDSLVQIPMVDGPRCLNVSSAAAIGLYTAIRQMTP